MKRKMMLLCLGMMLAGGTLSGCASEKSKTGEGNVPTEITLGTDTEKTEETEGTEDKQNQLTAEEILEEIELGWNLGNSLDSCVNGSYRNLEGSYDSSCYETAWGNPVTTQEMIDTVSEAGFQAVRIPVTWYYNTYEEDGVLKIQESWLRRVKEVVDYAYEKDMYVILNSHHDGEIIYVDSQEYPQIEKRVKELWTAIAEYFKDYDEHLIFGGLNEVNDKSNSWQTKKEYLTMNNQLNQVYVDAVRSTGGNNHKRLLLCGTYLNALTREIIDGFQLPEDSAQNLLAADVHLYSTLYGKELEEKLALLDTLKEKAGVPVVITEFGADTDFQPENMRAVYAANFVARAKAHHMSCFWWDDGGKYRLLDRTNLQWTEPEILSGLKNPQANEEEK